MRDELGTVTGLVARAERDGVVSTRGERVRSDS
jgi:hypothetical protein